MSENGVVVHNNDPYGKVANAVDDVGEAALDPYMKRLSDWARSPANPANIRINPAHTLGALNDKGLGTGGH